jgi:hypothetical protein
MTARARRRPRRLQVTLTAAVNEPAEVGLNTTEIRQLAPGARELPQLLVSW